MPTDRQERQIDRPTNKNFRPIIYLFIKYEVLINIFCHLGRGEGHLLSVVVQQAAEVNEQPLGGLGPEESHLGPFRSNGCLHIYIIYTKCTNSMYHVPYGYIQYSSDSN